MPLDNRGGVSPGSAFGSIISKVVKKSPGKTLGKTIGNASKGSGGGRRRTYPENRNSGGSGSRRTYPENNNSGGGNSGRGAPQRGIPGRPLPKPSTNPSLDAYLGTDSAYQSVVNSGKRALADFLSEMTRRRGEAGTQFNQTKASMERDRVQQLEDIRNEFASRGLIQSGLFGEEQGKFQQQFTQQQTALGQQQAALLADLLSQEKNFRREQQLALEAAKQEALARRAAKYKIGA